MPITNTEKWNRYIEKNTDEYGKCCVDIARKVMEILDKGEEFDCHKLICKAEKEIGESGITGFMAGCIADMISKVHSRGGEFRKKWNEGYGVKDEKRGTINPALVEVTVN